MPNCLCRISIISSLNVWWDLQINLEFSLWEKFLTTNSESLISIELLNVVPRLTNALFWSFFLFFLFCLFFAAFSVSVSFWIVYIGMPSNALIFSSVVFNLLLIPSVVYFILSIDVSSLEVWFRSFLPFPFLSSCSCFPLFFWICKVYFK